MVWSSSSLPLRCTRSIAVMIMPGVQNPHCRPWCSRKASCIGCSGAPSAASPSIVLTSWPSAITASVVQDFTALPSRWTTQAPHCEVSHPTCVPVRRRFSRKNCTSSVRGSTLALTGLPFTIMEILAISTLFTCVRTAATQSFHISQGIIWAIPAMSNLAAERTFCLPLHRLGEIGEKFIGQFLGGPVDQPLSELGQLAADLRLDIVFQQGTAVLFGQPDNCATLGKSGDAALALAGNLVAIRRIEIAQSDATLEARRYRPDLHFCDRP